jgi:hypothetical protein
MEYFSCLYFTLLTACAMKKKDYKELLLRDLFEVSTFKFSSIVRLKHNQSFVTPQWAVRIMYKVMSLVVFSDK